MQRLTALRMNELEEKWGGKYQVVIESWRRSWDRLTTYFRYGKSIRKLIHTTNMIGGFNRQVRKVTKTKGAFTSNTALLKFIYLGLTQLVLHFPRSGLRFFRDR